MADLQGPRWAPRLLLLRRKPREGRVASWRDAGLSSEAVGSEVLSADQGASLWSEVTDKPQQGWDTCPCMCLLCISRFEVLLVTLRCVFQVWVP